MELVREALRYVHVVLGFTGLVAFWVPVFAKKGSTIHVRFGKIFAWCVYAVAASAIVNSTILMIASVQHGEGPGTRPGNFGFLIFLCYLGWVTLASGRHAVRVVETKNDHARLDTPFHRLLAIVPALGSVVIVVYALAFWTQASIVFLLLGTIGISLGRDIWRYMKRSPGSKMSWWYEHMGAMLGTGIAFHTAFAVFGAARLFDYTLIGPFAFVPWVLPAAIGIPAIHFWTRHYQRKFGDLPQQPVEANASP